MVEFSYLAVGDKILVNRSTLELDEDGTEWTNTHGGPYKQHILIKWDDAEDKTVLTALLNYQDIDEWDGSLCWALTYLSNHDLGDELITNVIDMYIDALHNSGFCGTYIGDLLEEANQKSERFYIRTVDFQMHEPSLEDIHPGFDT
jgi:hypothetical protein